MEEQLSVDEWAGHFSWRFSADQHGVKITRASGNKIRATFKWSDWDRVTAWIAYQRAEQTAKRP